jgi:hypothetical protein
VRRHAAAMPHGAGTGAKEKTKSRFQMLILSTEAQTKIDDRKQRWLDFYDPSKPPTSLFLIRYMPELEERPWPRPQEYTARLEWSWRKYQLQVGQLAWLEDDTLPFLDLYTGTEIFAAAFGCEVHYPEKDMPFAMPCIRSADEVTGIAIPGLDSPVIALLFAMAEELKRRAGPQALLHMVDLQSPMDIAALIWDKTQFYPALIQNPEAVRALADKVRTFMVSFLDEWFARFGREFISHYPDYYMPYGITISEDEVGAVSGKMFNGLFLPELVELSERYGGIGMHCCANSRHQWENFKKIPGLRLLNLGQPPEVIRKAVDYFAGFVPQWHSYGCEGPAWTWPGQYPPQARLVYEIYVSSKEEALETSARMREVLGR